MSDNKVTLPREVAEALDMAIDRFGKENVLKYQTYDKDGWGSKLTALNSFDFMTLASALVNGYTVETTPEEKVREFYETYNESFNELSAKYEDSDYDSDNIQRYFFAHGTIYGIKKTLNLLGIRIEGVNA